MNFLKSKIFVFSVLGIIIFAALVFVFSSSSALTNLSKDIFPSNLNGIPLIAITEDMPDEDIVEGLSADYMSNDENREIIVIFWRMTSEEVAEREKGYVIDDLKYEYDNFLYSGFITSIDWGDTQKFSTRGAAAVFADYKACSWGECMNSGLVSATKGDYLIFIQLSDYENYKPTKADLRTLLTFFIDKIPGDTPPPPPPPPPSPPEPPEPPTTGPVCGNENCEYEDGEDCDNCIQDCRLKGYCCFPEYNFIYNHDYHNKNYDKIHEPPGGVIPSYAFLIPKGTDEDDLPLRSTSICYGGGMTTGECIRNWECLSGVCTVDHWCIKTVAEKEQMWQDIEDELVAQQVFEDQTSYKKEYVDAYYDLEDSTVQKRIREAKLNVSLEVQGNTAGEIPEVNEGDPVDVRLEIENDSSYALGLTAGIFYPGYDSGMFDLEEKKYTMSFEWSGGLSSLLGSFKTKLINGKFIIMPPGSKFYVYSRVVPKQTGYLDAQGLIFYTTEEKYQKKNPGFTDDVPSNYQESEVSKSILVIEKPCNWWPFCL